MSATDLAPSLLFVVGACILAAVRGRKPRRFRLWWAPLLALVFAGTTIGVSLRVDQWRPWESVLAPWVDSPWLRGFEQMLVPVTEWLTVAARLVNRYLNLGVLFMFAAMKIVVGLALAAVPDQVMARASIAYREDPEHEHAVRPALSFARTFLSGTALAAGLFGVFHAAGIVANLDWGVRIAWPAVAFLILAEGAWYLRGPEAALVLKRVEDRPTGEKPPLEPAGLDALVSEYRRLWERWLLTGDDFRWHADDLVDPPDHAECRAWLGRHAETQDCIALEQMVEGRDVLLVDNLVYRLKPVLGLYLADQLLRGRRLLMLVGQEHQVRDAQRFVVGMLGDEAIRVLDHGGAMIHEGEVIVMTLRQAFDKPVLRAWKDHRTILLVMDANATALWHGAEVRALRQSLADLSGSMPQFIGLADWRIDLEESLRNVIGVEVQDLRLTRDVEHSHYLVWRTESPSDLVPPVLFQNVVFTEIGSRLTPETSLLYPALRHKIAPVHLVEQSALPWSASLNEAGNSVDHLRSPYGPVGFLSAGERVQIAPADWAIAPNNGLASILVARDQASNMPWAARKWMSLSDHGTLVHVVSPPYLYRDFFAAHLHTFLDERRRFSSLAPLNLTTTWAKAFALYRRLAEVPVSAADVQRALDEIGGVYADIGVGSADGSDTGLGLEEVVGSRSLGSHLEQLFRDELDPGGVEIQYETKFVFSESRGYVPSVHFALSPASIANPPSWMQVVEFVGKEIVGGGEPLILDSAFLGQLHQAFLPGQAHAFSGNVYELTRFEVSDGRVRRVYAESRPTVALRHYRQLRSYDVELEGAQERPLRLDAEPDEDRVKLSLNWYVAPVTARTNGYLSFYPELANDLARARSHIRGLEVPDRRYAKGKVLRARFLLTPELGDISVPHVGFTLALLLNEAFASYYPEVKQFLVATTPIRPDIGSDPSTFTRRLLSLVPELTVSLPPTTGEPLCLDVFFIEDSRFDLGSLSSLVQHLPNRLLTDLAGYLAWLEEELGRPVPPNGAHHLFFGGTTLPEQLDITGVRRLLESYLGAPVASYRPGVTHAPSAPVGSGASVA